MNFQNERYKLEDNFGERNKEKEKGGKREEE